MYGERGDLTELQGPIVAGREMESQKVRDNQKPLWPSQEAQEETHRWALSSQTPWQGDTHTDTYTHTVHLRDVVMKAQKRVSGHRREKQKMTKWKNERLDADETPVAQLLFFYNCCYN